MDEKTIRPQKKVLCVIIKNFKYSTIAYLCSIRKINAGRKSRKACCRSFGGLYEEVAVLTSGYFIDVLKRY
ncbi:MAG TPA: hypothetical protein DCR40_08415 [Prolixibacteraceae bacterium]|nr:hypothetical protein [Prolixibacteraceae bacterium]